MALQQLQASLYDGVLIDLVSNDSMRAVQTGRPAFFCTHSFKSGCAAEDESEQDELFFVRAEFSESGFLRMEGRCKCRHAIDMYIFVGRHWRPAAAADGGVDCPSQVNKARVI